MYIDLDYSVLMFKQWMILAWVICKIVNSKFNKIDLTILADALLLNFSLLLYYVY